MHSLRIVTGLCIALTWPLLTACSDDSFTTVPPAPTTTTGGAGGMGGTTSTSTGGNPSTGGSGGTPTTCPGGAPGCVEDWAGQFNQMGSADGVGQLATFQFIAGMTSTGGVLYVSADHAIRAVDIATATVTTFAGMSGQTGYVDDVGNAARFDDVVGLATDGTTLWVAERGNSVIRAINIASATVSTLSGQQGNAGHNDGNASQAQFDAMRELTYDGSHLYLIEASAVLRRIDPQNGDVVTVAGSYNQPGLIDASGAAARFAGPRFVEAIGTGNLYVGDTENSRPRHVLVTGTQGDVTSPYGSTQGFADGNGSNAQFDRLRGVAFDGDGLVIADSDNFVIRHVDLTSDEVTTIAGTAGNNAHAVGIGAAAGFDKPLDLHFDAATGDVFIAEGPVIRRFYYK